MHTGRAHRYHSQKFLTEEGRFWVCITGLHLHQQRLSLIDVGHSHTKEATYYHSSNKCSVNYLKMVVFFF